MGVANCGPLRFVFKVEVEESAIPTARADRFACNGLISSSTALFHYLLHFPFRTVVLHDVSLSAYTLNVVVSDSRVHIHTKGLSLEAVSDSRHADHCCVGSHSSIRLRPIDIQV